MLESLRKIINPDVVLGIATYEKQLVIKEGDPLSKIKKLTINGIPERSFAFTLDYQPGNPESRHFKQLSKYVNSENGDGVNKGCDLVLFFTDNENKPVFLIMDLKSEKPNMSETSKQLLNSELYVRYLLSMTKSFYGIRINNAVFKQSIVTTSLRNVSRSPIYRSNKVNRKQYLFTNKTVVVNNRKEARVQLGALL